MESQERPAPTPGGESPHSPRHVVGALFGALASHDADAVAACFAPGAIEHSIVAGELHAPAGVRAFFLELFASYPDLQYAVIEVVERGDLAAVRYQSVGTFRGAPFKGLEATGERILLDGLETLEVRDGLIRRLDQVVEGAESGRPLAPLPRAGSGSERLAKVALNARTRLRRSRMLRRRCHHEQSRW